MYLAKSVYDPSWYIDSGTSSHFTLDQGNLMHKSSYAGQDHVYVGNGNGLKINHVGNSTIKSPTFANSSQT